MHFCPNLPLSLVFGHRIVCRHLTRLAGRRSLPQQASLCLSVSDHRRQYPNAFPPISRPFPTLELE